MKAWWLLIWMLVSGVAWASGHGGESGGGDAGMVKFEALIVNLQNGRHIGFVPQLKLADPADGEYVKACMPALRHQIIKSLIGKDANLVQTTEFIGGFSHSLPEALNRLLGGEYIKDVFFESWIVQ